MAYYEGDISGLTSGNNGGVFGGEGGWWAGIIGLIAVAAIFGGFGNGGLFGGGSNAATQGALTREQACIDNNFNNLSRNVEGIANSVNVGFANLNSTICAQQYDTAQMINGLGMNMMQGFNTANVTALQGFNGVQSQLASCCCDLSRQIERLGCEAASNTGAIIAAGQANTQRVLDYLCQEKISALQSELATANATISQQAQSAYIINSLRPFPVASYQVPNPFTGSFGYGYNNGCGCGCNG